ncbi:MAG: hypothetical protein HYU63_07565 [Armatimonadetes bacterium]|nr:hypothetical protein [Armatimonadota bacterium]
MLKKVEDLTKKTSVSIIQTKAPSRLENPKDEVTISKDIKVNTLPQDPLVSEVKTVEIPQEEAGKNLIGKRVVTQDRNNPIAIADPDGNYFYALSTPQFDQVNAHNIAYRTLAMFEKLLGRKIPWAFAKEQIFVLPHAQEGKNAYYDRWGENVSFFYFNSPELKKIVQTSQSQDVVSHEGGHAALDGLRPGYLYSFDKEIRAFHEAFGDITAMMLALQDEDNLDKVISETKGDLTKESLITRLGEEFGKAVHLANQDPNDDNRIYLRSALNNFKYADPNTLPNSNDENTLTGEAHNFSRLFTAAFYDILTSLFKEFKNQNLDDKTALTQARDVLSKIFTYGIELSPRNSGTYNEIAKAMLSAEKNIFGGKYKEILKNIFKERKILSLKDLEEVDHPLPEINLPKINISKGAINLLKQNLKRLNLPENINLKVEEIFTNQKGETFIHYKFAKDIPLDKSCGRYQEYSVNLSGGVSLAFNQKGKLFHFNFDPVSKEKISRNILGLKEIIRENLICRHQGKGGGYLKGNNQLYKAAYMEKERKIIPVPVID